MKSLTETYLVIHFIGEPPANGKLTEFEQLHVTVMPDMAVYAHHDERRAALMDAVEEVAANYAPVTMKLGEDAMFGTAGNVPVRRLEKNEAIGNLHHRLLRLIRNGKLNLLRLHHGGKNYNPHVSLKNGEKLSAPITVDSLTVVKHVGTLCTNVEVLGTYKLTGKL